MLMRIEVECSPTEARQFMGLPDVSALNEHLVEEMKRRMDANMAMMTPDAMMKSWMQMGLQTQEAFLNMMSASTRGARKP
jgi:hypothetical protein